MTRLVLLGSFGLAGCAGSPTARRADQVLLTLTVDALPAGAAMAAPLRPGRHLRSGDSIALHVEVDRPAHVYVVRTARDGSRLLFPLAGDPVQQPGKPLRLPLAGAPGDLAERYVMDDQPGEERIYAIATTRPLQQAAPGVCLKLGIRCPGLAGDGRTDDDPPPPPEGVPQDERGGGPVELWRGASLRVLTDPQGVAVLRFTFHHDP
jgi:hypothetical protein